MIKLLKLPYSDNFNPINIGTVAAVALAGSSTITLSTESGITAPQYVMIEDHLSEYVEFAKILSIDSSNGIVATLEKSLSNNHGTTAKVYSVSDVTYEIVEKNEDETYAVINSERIVDATASVIVTEVELDSEKSNLYTHFPESDSYVSIPNTIYSDELMVGLSDANSFLIPSDSTLSDPEKYSLILSATSLVNNELGFSISKKEVSESDVPTITGTFGRQKESVLLPTTRPVVSINAETPVVVTDHSGETSTIDSEDVRIRKGCPILNSKDVGPRFSIHNQTVSQANNTFSYSELSYTGGLDVIPNEVMHAMKLYIKMLTQINETSDNSSFGIKKQKHYNREIQYFEPSSTTNPSNPVLDSVSSKSAATLLSTIKYKYGGF